MKILMVTMAMNIGGAETHILELCRELKAQGVEVTLASNGGVYADELVREGIAHVSLPLHSKEPTAVIRSYLGLRRLIRDGGFDIVHAHARIPAFICGLLNDTLISKNGEKFRFVTTAHLNFSTNSLLRKMSRWGERVMAVSDDIVDYLVDEYGYPRDKIGVTINGIDTKKFSPETDIGGVLAAHGLDPAHRRIVYMSRLDEDRADPAFRLVRIAPEIEKKFPNTDIIIVGGGNVYDKIKALADGVNKAVGRELVTMTGAVSNTNEYCAAATIFIGVSRSALEAMASAKPTIIAGNQGALGVFCESKIKSSVDTNFCCRGFDVADEQTLLDDITSLLSSTESELAAMGEYNREFILENYTARRMARDYLGMYEKTLSSPVPIDARRASPDIVMSGYYGFGNLGDESLLDIITESLAEEIPGVRIAALTNNTSIERRRTGISCVPRFDPLSLSHALKRSSMLISGGGSLLQDKTSRRSLGYYAGVISYAEKCGTKTAVLANGIGPITYEKNKKKTRSVIDRVDFVSVRDRESKAELERLGVKNTEKIRVSADPAILIRPSSEHALDRAIEKLGLDGKKYFAVSLRPLASQIGKKGALSDDDRRIVDEVGKACADIAARHSLVPLIIPMQRVQDERICSTLCDRLESDGVPSVMMIPDSARDLIGILGRSELAIGMRLHIIIFASSASCPVIGLSYDPKVSGMMAELGQDFVIDMTSGEPFEGQLTAYADDVLANGKEIRAALEERAHGMRERCREDMKALHDLLRK